MNTDIFDIIKEQIDARELVSKFLGTPANTCGENHYWHSPFYKGDNEPSFTATQEQITDFSISSDFGKGQDIFNFIVKYNDLKHCITPNEMNYYDALRWVNEEYKLKTDLALYNNINNSSKSKEDNSKSDTNTIIKYKLNVSEGKHPYDCAYGIYAMFDTEGFKQKPESKRIGKIKNRIKDLSAGSYSPEEIKNKLITGHTCIPAGIKSKKDWVDGENFYQVFMVDIDNVATVDGEKQKYMVDDEQHVTVKKIVEYCNSINLPPTFIYYTFSHSEQQHKFRLVYILDIATSDKKVVEGIYDFLKETFKDYNIDTAPTDISSLFLGGQSIADESDTYYDIVYEEIEVIEETSEEETTGENCIKYTETEKQCNEFLKYTQYEARHRRLGYITKNDNFVYISNFVPYCINKVQYINGNDNITKYEMNCELLDRPEIKLPALLIDANGYAKCNFIMRKCLGQALYCSSRKWEF